MNLPNAASAIVSREKLTGYLLSPHHLTGRGKAAFFTGFGFTSDDWSSLEAALLGHAQANDVVEVRANEYGEAYAVEGPLQCPDGRGPQVCSVWFIAAGETVPRFVTAYPVEHRPTIRTQGGPHDP